MPPRLHSPTPENGLPCSGDAVMAAELTPIRAVIASMQHELRTPANTIVGYASAILEGLEPGSEVSADASCIVEMGEQIVQLVDTFLAQGVGSSEEMEPRVRRLRHDVASCLHAVDGYAELLLEDNPSECADLHHVMSASRRLHLATDQIKRSLGKGETPQPTGTDATLVHDAMCTLRALPARSPLSGQHGRILVVEDDPLNRDLMLRQIQRFGYDVDEAVDGKAALDWLETHPVDVVLLDIIMPRMNGYQVLAAMKADEKLRHTPVVVVSAFDDIDSITRCIEMGADDYLPKRFNPALLQARLHSCLDRKRMRDRQQTWLEEIDRERSKTDALLLNILPSPTAARLKAGEQLIADSFDDVTVLFADLCGFTQFAATRSADSVVRHLNSVFNRFDELTERYGLEKIKTIGDEYMLAGGLPVPREDHAEAVVAMGLEMLQVVNEFQTGTPALRIGIHSGPVVAGVIGQRKFAYDLWGDTVNIASRMQSHGVPGRIQLSSATRSRLPERFAATRRGSVDLKGRGAMETFLLGPNPDL
jgi:class 3 adenylate cyclase